VRVDVVHSAGIPARAAGHQNRTLIHLSFTVSSGRQISDRESPDIGPVAQLAVLSVSNDHVIQNEHSPAWPCLAWVSIDNRTVDMFLPWTEEIVGIEESQRVASHVRIGLSKQPPFIGMPND
jgi:hypothetical protein